MSPTDPSPRPPPVLAVRAAIWLFGAVERLRRRLLPPQLVLFDNALGVARTHAVAAAARHRFADHLAGGPLTAAELAARAGLHPEATHRLVRALAALGAFRLLPDGRLANNRVSAYLRTDRADTLHHAVVYWSQPAQHLAWSNIDHWLTTGRSSLAHVAGRSVWALYDDDIVQGETFAEMMAGLSRQDAAAIATSWPFARAGSVCDVGGGRGIVLAEILVRNPDLRGALVDGPRARPHAERLFAERGVADRATIATGSFFDPGVVPAGHGAYVLKNVLHDWDDATCVRILERVREAAAAGTPILVYEDRLERTETSFSTATDLHMALACDDGRERSEAELVALLAAAGLAHVATRRTASTSWLFEAVRR